MPANNMTELVERYGGQLKQALARNCLAVRVSVHGVTRERTISESKVMIDDKPVEDEFQATGKVKLVPQEIATALDRIANRARNLPARYGVRMPGMYLVPIGADDSGPAAKLFQELAELRTEYRAKAQEYVGRPTVILHGTNRRTCVFLPDFLYLFGIIEGESGFRSLGPCSGRLFMGGVGRVCRRPFRTMWWLGRGRAGWWRTGMTWRRRAGRRARGSR